MLAEAFDAGFDTGQAKNEVHERKRAAERDKPDGFLHDVVAVLWLLDQVFPSQLLVVADRSQDQLEDLSLVRTNIVSHLPVRYEV